MDDGEKETEDGDDQVDMRSDTESNAESARDSDFYVPPPYWFMESVEELRESYPGAIIDVVSWFGKAGKLSAPIWKVQCMDCSSTVRQYAYLYHL